MAKISKRLTKLLQKAVPFNFDSNYVEHFNYLKTARITNPIGIYPNFEGRSPSLLPQMQARLQGSVLSQGHLYTIY